MLRHEVFGGVTHFQSLLGTNIPLFTPDRTPLRRTIRHILDYGIKPAWSLIPSGQTDDYRLTLDARLHPD